MRQWGGVLRLGKKGKERKTGPGEKNKMRGRMGAKGWVEELIQKTSGGEDLQQGSELPQCVLVPTVPPVLMEGNAAFVFFPPTVYFPTPATCNKNVLISFPLPLAAAPSFPLCIHSVVFLLILPSCSHFFLLTVSAMLRGQTLVIILPHLLKHTYVTPTPSSLSLSLSHVLLSLLLLVLLLLRCDVRSQLGSPMIWQLNACVSVMEGGGGAASVPPTPCDRARQGWHDSSC